jgi:hypothetical protein
MRRPMVFSALSDSFAVSAVDLGLRAAKDASSWTPGFFRRVQCWAGTPRRPAPAQKMETESGIEKGMHRMEKARHQMNRYKTRKTNEIWLLGVKCKSGTLDSVDLLQENRGRGYYVDPCKVKAKGPSRLVRDGLVMRFWSRTIISTEIL